MAEVNLYHPAQVDAARWRLLQGIEWDAYRATLDDLVVSDADIAELLSMDDPERFLESHVHPNGEVGRRFNANQVYAHPRVAVATEGDEIVGWGFAAHNASYGPPEGPQDNSLRAHMVRNAKLGSAVLPPLLNKSYFAVREVAVVPWWMHRGIGKQILGTLLRGAAVPWQPVTAYDWPDIDPAWMRGALERHGFRQTGISQSRVFGAGTSLVRQARLQAATARSVLRSL